MTKDRFYQIFYGYKKRECTTRDLAELLEDYIEERKGVRYKLNQTEMIYRSEITNVWVGHAFDYYNEKFSQ